MAFENKDGVSGKCDAYESVEGDCERIYTFHLHRYFFDDCHLCKYKVSLTPFTITLQRPKSEAEKKEVKRPMAGNLANLAPKPSPPITKCHFFWSALNAR